MFDEERDASPVRYRENHTPYADRCMSPCRADHIITLLGWLPLRAAWPYSHYGMVVTGSDVRIAFAAHEGFPRDCLHSSTTGEVPRFQELFHSVFLPRAAAVNGKSLFGDLGIG